MNYEIHNNELAGFKKYVSYKNFVKILEINLTFMLLEM